MYCNIDVNDFGLLFLKGILKNSDFEKETLCLFVDKYAGTKVTDLAFNIFGQYSDVDTEFWSTYADKYNQKMYKGKPVDFTDFYEGIYTVNKKYNTDPYDVWIKRSKEIGINPWIAVRMNDCHKNDFLKSDFYDVAEENGWLLGDKYGYFGTCYNYKIKIVREKMLGYIAEQILKYDVYGIELDFMREIYCFDYIDDDMDECVDIMNRFMREVKASVGKAEEKFGHRIKIAVRLCRDIDQALAFGFDARTWAKEKLIDVIIPSPRYHYIDSLIPISRWKKELSGIEILGCMECNLSADHTPRILMTAESARGLAAGMLSDGADGIYLYNYYCAEVPERDIEVYKTCDSLESISGHKLRYVVRCQEYCTCPKPLEPYRPLPVILLHGEADAVQVRTGKVEKNKKMTLVLGFECGNPTDITVDVNQKICKEYQRYSLPEVENAENSKTCCYSYPFVSDGEMIQNIGICCVGETIEISWIEIVYDERES